MLSACCFLLTYHIRTQKFRRVEEERERRALDESDQDEPLQRNPTMPRKHKRPAVSVSQFGKVIVL